MSNSLRDRLQALVQEMRDRYRRGDWGSATYWADRITALLAEPAPEAEDSRLEALRRMFDLHRDQCYEQADRQRESRGHDAARWTVRAEIWDLAARCTVTAAHAAAPEGKT